VIDKESLKIKSWSRFPSKKSVNFFGTCSRAKAPSSLASKLKDGRTTKGTQKERRVSGLPKKRPAEKERGQRPLWIAIGGLLVSVLSYTMRDLMLGDVVFWFGVVLAFIGVLYWFIRPKHGL